MLSLSLSITFLLLLLASSPLTPLSDSTCACSLPPVCCLSVCLHTHTHACTHTLFSPSRHTQSCADLSFGSGGDDAGTDSLFFSFEEGKTSLREMLMQQHLFPSACLLPSSSSFRRI
ncbi:hypothetical protein AMECASPLE_018029 [Ameca splendens]|uniref:Secreted protein n=1 Tax=Ameca splendens TaxID=208324 RepID=A0ABV1ABM0_9TELE